MKAKSPLKSLPKPDPKAGSDPVTETIIDPEVLELAHRLQTLKVTVPDVAGKAMGLISRATELGHPVFVERWQLQQVYDLLYSIELIVEHWGQSHDEEAVDIVYMLRPHINQFSSLFDSDGEEPNLWSVLRDSKQQKGQPHD